MWEIRVQAHPASVTAAVKSGDLVPQLLWRLAVNAQVALAAKLDRGIAHVDAHALLPSCAQPPQLGGGERCSRDARLCGGADGERGRERRLAAGQHDRIERFLALPGVAPQRGEHFVWMFGRTHDAPTVSTRRSPR